MNFNQALEKATQIATTALGELQQDIFLVRDLHGRIRVLLKSRKPPADLEEAVAKAVAKALDKAIKNLKRELTTQLGAYAYAAGDLFLFRDSLPNVKFPDAASASSLAELDGYTVYLHDRLLTGTEWNARPVDEAKDPRRFTLFSMRGGVGRSTTAVVLAQHLAKKGKRVVVMDLDLESPGVGSTLLGSNLPRFGIVDWFVEDALGQGAMVLPDMVQESHLADGTDGRIAVVPAFGKDTDHYLTKLGRATLDRGPNGYEAWADRLKRLVETIESIEEPDVVLLDSRTGLHDTSASLVMAMGANTLLFAIDTRQTWSAYQFLFKHWKRHPNRTAFREKLWVLGAMVPDTNRDAYAEGLRDRAWELFNESLYDAVDAEADPDAIAYAATDDIGNHYPRPIYWLRSLMAFDPLAEDAQRDVANAYGEFLDWFDQVLLEEGAPAL